MEPHGVTEQEGRGTDREWVNSCRPGAREEVFGDSQNSAGGGGRSRNLTCEDVKKNRRREKVAAVSADDSFEVFRVMIYQEAEQ